MGSLRPLNAWTIDNVELTMNNSLSTFKSLFSIKNKEEWGSCKKVVTFVTIVTFRRLKCYNIQN